MYPTIYLFDDQSHKFSSYHLRGSQERGSWPVGQLQETMVPEVWWFRWCILAKKYHLAAAENRVEVGEILGIS